MDTQQSQDTHDQAVASDVTSGTSFVGIDVSKARLDVAARPSGDALLGVPTGTGIAALVVRLRVLAPQLIVLEATDGLEQLPTAALAGMLVAVVNPRQTRNFAKATGRLAKTDAVDAAVLAHFAQALLPIAHPLPDAATQLLAPLHERGQQLVNLLTAEKNRL